MPSSREERRGDRAGGCLSEARGREVEQGQRQCTSQGRGSKNVFPTKSVPSNAGLERKNIGSGRTGASGPSGRPEIGGQKVHKIASTLRMTGVTSHRGVRITISATCGDS